MNAEEAKSIAKKAATRIAEESDKLAGIRVNGILTAVKRNAEAGKHRVDIATGKDSSSLQEAVNARLQNMGYRVIVDGEDDYVITW